MASANALAPLRWKRAKIHRGSRRRRRSLTPHKEAGYTSAVVTLGPEFAKPACNRAGSIYGRQWYGPRPPGGGYHEPSPASRENCHADRSHWLGSGEICLRDSWRRRVWQDGGAQDASSSRRVNVFRKPAAVPCRHGSLERRTLLGEDAFGPWP